MKKEKIILSFIAVLVGLFVAGLAFFLYQSTKKIPQSQTRLTPPASPTISKQKTSASVLLFIDNPKDESVSDSKTITVSGKTTSEAIVVISTELEDEVITPAINGAFSSTATLTDGQNQIVVTAIDQDGKETSQTLIVTFSIESF